MLNFLIIENEILYHFLLCYFNSGSSFFMCKFLITYVITQALDYFEHDYEVFLIPYSIHYFSVLVLYMRVLNDFNDYKSKR